MREFTIDPMKVRSGDQVKVVLSDDTVVSGVAKTIHGIVGLGNGAVSIHGPEQPSSALKDVIEHFPAKPYWDDPDVSVIINEAGMMFARGMNDGEEHWLPIILPFFEGLSTDTWGYKDSALLERTKGPFAVFAKRVSGNIWARQNGDC